MVYVRHWSPNLQLDSYIRSHNRFRPCMDANPRIISISSPALRDVSYFWFVLVKWHTTGSDFRYHWHQCPAAFCLASVMLINYCLCPFSLEVCCTTLSYVDRFHLFSPPPIVVRRATTPVFVWFERTASVLPFACLALSFLLVGELLDVSIQTLIGAVDHRVSKEAPPCLILLDGCACP